MWIFKFSIVLSACECGERERERERDALDFGIEETATTKDSCLFNAWQTQSHGFVLISLVCLCLLMEKEK